MMHRLMAAPDMWLAAMGSLLTTVFAAMAAFELSLPDRKPAWALLPLPALLLWIGASGMGCLRTWSIADADPMPLDQPAHCLIYILGMSLPLSLILSSCCGVASRCDQTSRQSLAGLPAPPLQPHCST